MLHVDNNTTVTTSQGMLKECTPFYKNLFTEEPTNCENQDWLLEKELENLKAEREKRKEEHKKQASKVLDAGRSSCETIEDKRSRNEGSCEDRLHGDRARDQRPRPTFTQ